MIRKIVKKILMIDRIRMARKRSFEEQVFENSPDNLKYSNINLDFRNRRIGKKYAKIGENSSVNATFTFETEEGFIEIGNHSFVGGGHFICRNGIIIEDYVQIAWNVTLYDHNAHSLDYRQRRKDVDVFLDNRNNDRNVLEGKDWSVVKSKPIRICSDAWIGMNTIILAGVTIGEGAVIGAGSVVRDDIPAWSIAYGNPCKVVAYNKNHP